MEIIVLKYRLPKRHTVLRVSGIFHEGCQSKQHVRAKLISVPIGRLCHCDLEAFCVYRLTLIISERQEVGLLEVKVLDPEARKLEIRFQNCSPLVSELFGIPDFRTLIHQTEDETIAFRIARVLRQCRLVD